MASSSPLDIKATTNLNDLEARTPSQRRRYRRQLAAIQKHIRTLLVPPPSITRGHMLGLRRVPLVPPSPHDQPTSSISTHTVPCADNTMKTDVGTPAYDHSSPDLHIGDNPPVDYEPIPELVPHLDKIDLVIQEIIVAKPTESASILQAIGHMIEYAYLEGGEEPQDGDHTSYLRQLQTQVKEEHLTTPTVHVKPKGNSQHQAANKKEQETRTHTIKQIP